MKHISDMEGTNTGYKDICGKEICVGDIVKYPRYECSDFTIIGEVKFGEYKQDGSDGEYSPVLCCGYYVEFKNMIYPVWVYQEDYEDYDIKDYEREQSLAEIVHEVNVEIISR